MIHRADLESRAGERLLCRTEFQSVAEAAASLIYTKRTSTQEPKQSGILYGKLIARRPLMCSPLCIAGVDGSLRTVTSMRDAVYKRLQLLERQLQRHTQHAAGLNPRALRSAVCLSHLYMF